MARKQFSLPGWAWILAAIIGLFFVVNYLVSPITGTKMCPGSQVYCPGVGCVSGQDKCFAGSLGGASAIFSKETFTEWPGVGVRAKPPTYDVAKETFVSKKCPDGTRSDGPCLMEF
jgi:hypothetical protein